MSSMINLDDKISQLAEFIYLKKVEKKCPVLLLGADCSVSSKCPSAQSLIEKIICSYNINLNSKESTFRDIEDNLNTAIFNLDIANYFSNSDPSKGYWFLGELIRYQYFDLILTTSYDTCIEKILSKILDFDDFKVLVRGDIDDKRISQHIEIPKPKIKIIKLCGDFLTKNSSIDPYNFWNIKDSLTTILYNEIKERGIISIGNSKYDSFVFKNFFINNANKLYLACGLDEFDDIKNNISNTSKMVHIPQSDFGELMRSITWELGKIDEKKIRKTERLRNDFNEKTGKNLDELISVCNMEIERKLIENLVIELQNLIEKNCSESNLVFIHDPDCPGGTEILQIMENKFKRWIEHKNITKLIIKGRGPDVYDRSVTDYFDRNDNKIYNNEILKNGKYLLIDSVSFSGGTLKKCKDKLFKILSKHHCNDFEISAAVIFSGLNLKYRLSGEKFLNRLFKLRITKAHQILFPWGHTISTEPIFPKTEDLSNELEIINEFIPHQMFTFWPRPWGNILSFIENKLVSVKILDINPGEKLSKQKHYVRDEIFIVLDDHITLQIWKKNILLRKGDSFRVPAGTVHRLIALDMPCRVLEIATKYYDQVDDIERFEDKYNRVRKRGNV